MMQRETLLKKQYKHMLKNSKKMRKNKWKKLKELELKLAKISNKRNSKLLPLQKKLNKLPKTLLRFLIN